MSLLCSTPLNIIMEEDELSSSCSSSSSCSRSSRSPSPSTNIKAKRRHARITRDDLANLDSSAFLSPRPPPSSPASLNLAFPELLHFPSPPPISDYLSSSPGAHSSGLPLTPSDSDDGFAMLSPRINPRRAAMHPLSFNFRVDSDSDPESDSDSDWYHNEFSKHIASLPSVSQPLQPSRPDSVFIPSDFNIPAVKPISHTSYPYRRNSKSRSVIFPKSPLPPVPPIPQHLRSPTNPNPTRFSRPPPRSSVPADCIYDLYMDGDNEHDADSDSSSAFSFTMYEIDFGERQRQSNIRSHTLPRSPALSRPSSLISEEGDLDLDDARFELEYRLTLPSLPVTPLDLEADIAKSFERLREQTILEEPKSESAATQPTSVPMTPPETPEHAQDLVYTSSLSSFSFSSSPSPVSFLAHHASGCNADERVLKSKWSSSTLGSIKEEQARKKNGERGRSTSAKLKLYFTGGGNSTPSKASKHSSFSSTKPVVPPTPTSPFFSRPPTSPSSSSTRKSKTFYSPPLSPSPLRWPHSPRTYKPNRTSTRLFTPTHQSTHSAASDVILIGYPGHGGAVLKRRGSNATVSSEGGMSEVSTSSSSSSGLRRKPIPIEMFIRNAV